VEDGRPEAGQHQHQDDQALEDHQAHGVGPGHARGDRVGDEGVQSQPGGQGEREVRHEAHEQGQHACDQGGGGGDAGEVPTGELLAVGVGRPEQDDRVEHDDVGHREERDDAAADLAADRGATLGDAEEGVELSSGRGRPLLGAGVGHVSPHSGPPRGRGC
jgi:hypothetical protein